MKKKLLTLLLIPFIVGCNTKNSKYPSYVLNSPWGEEIATKMYDTFHALIPYMEAEEYEFEYTVDEYGDDILGAYLYYTEEEIAESKVNEYAELCYSKGYDVEQTTNTYIDWDNYTIYEYEVAYASKVIKDSIGFEMQVLASMRASRPCLGIFAYNYVYCPKDAWPNAAVDHLLGDRSKLIPSYNIEGGTYNFIYDVDTESGSICLEIQLTGGSYADEQAYFNLIKEKGYIQAQRDDLDDDYIVRVDNYEYFNDQYFYMCMPADDIMLIYDYNMNNQTFIVDIWLIKNNKA